MTKSKSSPSSEEDNLSGIPHPAQPESGITPPSRLIIEGRHWFRGRPFNEQWESMELMLGRVIAGFGLVLTPGTLLALWMDGSNLVTLPTPIRIASSIGIALAMIGFVHTIRLLTRTLDHSDEPRPVRRALEEAYSRDLGWSLIAGVWMLLTAVLFIGITHLLTRVSLANMSHLPMRLIAEFFVHAGGMTAATVPMVFGAAAITRDDFAPALLWRLRVPINIVCSLVLTSLLHA